jgi:hypothetical protein
MKDVYAVLRHKELEQSRLENEVKALRVVAPLLGGDAEHDKRPTSRGISEPPRPDHSGLQASGKNRWP